MAKISVPFNFSRHIEVEIDEYAIQAEIDELVKTHIAAIKPNLADLAIRLSTAYIDSHLKNAVEKELESIVGSAVRNAVNSSSLLKSIRIELKKAVAQQINGNDV